MRCIHGASVPDPTSQARRGFSSRFSKEYPRQRPWSWPSLPRRKRMQPIQPRSVHAIAWHISSYGLKGNGDVAPDQLFFSSASVELWGTVREHPRKLACKCQPGYRCKQAPETSSGPQSLTPLTRIRGSGRQRPQRPAVALLGS